MEESLKVYGIVSKETGEIIYVGRTAESLEQRWMNHQISSMPVKRYMVAHGGFEMYYMELLRECDSMIDLIEWESHLILEMDPRCNVQGKYRPPRPINWCVIQNRNKRFKK